MTYYLVDKNNLIVNNIVVDEKTFATGWTPPAGQTLLQYAGPSAIGWTWDGVQALAPVVVTPVISPGGLNVIAN